MHTTFHSLVRSFFALALAGVIGLGCARDAQDVSTSPDLAPTSIVPSPSPSAVVEAATRPPNVLLVVVDTLRADEVVLDAGARDPTPKLRALAEGGAAFTTAYAHTATTTPSHATLFTSLYPTTHGVVKNGFVLQKKHLTLTDVLGDAGYQTAAVVSALPVVRSFGILQGFETIDDHFSIDAAVEEARSCHKSGVERCGELTTEAAIGWLANEREKERPFFLFVHYYDPHKRYAAPAPYAPPPTPFRANKDLKSQCRAGRERYRAEIAFVDDLIGQLVDELAKLGLADDTIVLVTADHGEAFFEHENCQHTGDLYEELVRIPLIVRWPSVIPARWRSSEPIGLVDVMPTVLDLVGRKPEGTKLQGRSVAGALRETDGRVEPKPLYFVRARFDKSKRLQGRRWIGTQYGVRDGRWKYMDAPDEKRRSLYDLETDPEESDNLIAERPDEASRLALDLTEWRKRTEGARPEWLESNGVDRKQLVEGLRALGYVE